MPGIVLTNWVGESGVPQAVEALKSGRAPLDVIEAGIQPTELDPTVPAVGLGGLPNMLGELELDAAVMDGSTFRTGAVGALKGYASALWVARQVMEVLPHVLLVGEGAARFAAERGARVVAETPKQISDGYQEWLKHTLPEEALAHWPSGPLASYAWPKPDPRSKKDTVVFLVRNPQGEIAAGTSTSGWGYKYPGRLGDSPIVGAGLYADSQFGGCVCTNTGEMTIRAGSARAVVAYMKAGASVQDACHEAVQDLRRLKGGYIGPVVLHAISSKGEPYVVTTTREDGRYCVWDTETRAIRRLDGVLDEISVSG